MLRGVLAFTATIACLAATQISRREAAKQQQQQQEQQQGPHTPSAQQSRGKEENQEEKTKNVLANTVKPVDRHVIVCGLGDPQHWPKRIEDMESSLLGRLSTMIADFSVGTSSKTKVTGCSLPNTMPGKTDVLLFPEAKVYRIDDMNLLSFAALVTDPAPRTPQGKESQTRWPKSMFNDIDVPFKHLVLVCAHASRDKRCGRSGPAVISRAQEILAASNCTDICVTSSTHIGGHEFAGTLLVYPRGDCYGHISDKGTVLQEVLSAVQVGCRVEKCFRGNALALSDW